MDREIGAIAPGKRADMILLDRDPLQDIRALRDVDTVFREGHIVARRGAIMLSNSHDP